MTRNNDPILVVGGGPGGAAVSLALARKGFRMRFALPRRMGAAA